MGSKKPVAAALAAAAVRLVPAGINELRAPRPGSGAVPRELDARVKAAPHEPGVRLEL